MMSRSAYFLSTDAGSSSSTVAPAAAGKIGDNGSGNSPSEEEEEGEEASSAGAKATPSFFHETSRRTLRRRRRREQLQRLRKRRQQQQRGGGGGADDYYEYDDDEEEEEDTRTVKDILFPGPRYGIGGDDADGKYGQFGGSSGRVRWPKSFGGWKAALSESWTVYRSTWNGFMTSTGFFVEDPPPPRTATSDGDGKGKQPSSAKSADDDGGDDDEGGSAGERALRRAGDEVAENARRNAEFLKVESERLRESVREATGIRTKDDLKKFAGEAMKLASECVREFMAGYRKGRDDETEKMLNQYFQDLDDDDGSKAESDASASDGSDKPANTKRRRKRKRRVVKG